MNAGGSLTGWNASNVNYVISDLADYDQNYPSIAYDSANQRYFVVWQDNRNGTDDIYGQIVNADGSLTGWNLSTVNYVVSDEVDNSQYFPSVAYDSTNQRYFVVWQDGRGDDIYGQIVNADGTLTEWTASTANFVISNASNTQSYPSVAYDRINHRYLVAWTDYHSADTYDIYGQFVNEAGTLLDTASDVNFPITIIGDDQIYPVVSINNCLNFIVAYELTDWTSYYDVAFSRVGDPCQPPTEFANTYPKDGANGLGTTTTFKWNESTDPNGGTVTYEFNICENESFTGCSPVNISSFEKKFIYNPGFDIDRYLWIGLLLLGIFFTFFYIAKHIPIIELNITKVSKILIPVLVIILTAGILLFSCGTDYSDSETSTITINIGRKNDNLKDPTGVPKAVPSIVSRVKFVISGSNMNNITRAIDITTDDTVTEVFQVPKGPNRSFEVYGYDSSDKLQYSGITSSDIENESLTLGITMVKEDTLVSSGEMSNTMTDLPLNTTYYWKVVARDLAGETVESASSSFTTSSF